MGFFQEIDMNSYLSSMIIHPDSVKINKDQGQYLLHLNISHFTSLFNFIFHMLLDWSVQAMIPFLKF